MTGFLAHLHPVLVHLPIGILLVAALFDWLSIKKRYEYVGPAVPWLLRFGAVAALLSCGTGWLLAQEGGYGADTLQQHQWLGFATAAAATTACIAPYRLAFSTLSALLLVLTGHLGGSLTHGADYLAGAFNDGGSAKRPADVQEVEVFDGVVAVIFREKCNACHGSGKQKGGLRLDSQEALLKGGESGVAIVPGNAAAGELIRRCLLPLGHDEHMPPKEKPQLTASELDILQWWITQGADIGKRTKELPQSASIRKALADWAGGGSSKKQTESDVPDFQVEAAQPALIAQLNQSGVVVMPVDQSGNWLKVSFTNLKNPSDSVMGLLERLSRQVIWLNLSEVHLPPSTNQVLGKLTRLTRLALDHSTASDTTLAAIAPLPMLQSVNLAHTRVTGQGVLALSNNKSLRRLYLYGSGVVATDWAMLTGKFQGVNLDTGGYRLPFLESDTARLKEEKKY
ncbi:MAG: hypothetical protein JNJ57_20940 [Saprospiraceae bacterium]|nr:hypothetical protein [Saprospiraceae bacterium]